MGLLRVALAVPAPVQPSAPQEGGSTDPLVLPGTLPPTEDAQEMGESPFRSSHKRILRLWSRFPFECSMQIFF